MALTKQEDEDTWLWDSVDIEDQKPDLPSIKVEVKTESFVLEIKDKIQDEARVGSSTKLQDDNYEEHNQRGECELRPRGGIRNKPTWKKAMKGAPISDKVANLCQFQCQECGKTYDTRGSLLSHFISSKLHLRPWGHLSNYITKITVHKCKICSTLMLCEKKVILSHLKRHNIKTMNQYSDNDVGSLLKAHAKKEDQKSKKNIVVNNERSEISKSVGNLCLYKCKKCGNTHECLGGMREHLRIVHKKRAPEMLAYECLFNIVIHECVICKETVLCDKGILKQHMKKHNKLSLEQYMNHYSVKETFPQRPRKSIQERLKEFSRIQSTNYKTSITLENLCKYSCELCDFTTKMWPLMREHNNAHHPNHILTTSQSITNVAFYKCKLCSEILLCDQAFISWHLKNRHKENITTYRKKAMVPAVKNLKKEYLLKLEAEISDVPKVPAKTSFVLETGALPDNLLTGDVGNLSLFQCLSCSELTLSYNALHRHYKLQQYKHKPKGHHLRSESIVVARYHKCHICAKIILCDSTLIRGHINKYHDVTYGTYIQEFVLKRGFRVLPYFKCFVNNRDCFDSISKHKKDNGDNDD